MTRVEQEVGKGVNLKFIDRRNDEQIKNRER